MQKNNKFYTFLFSRSSKSKIFIRRIEIPKSLVHFGSVGLFLVLGLTSLGVSVSGILWNTTLAKSVPEKTVLNQLSAKPVSVNDTNDYSRPNAAEANALNSGGPADDNETDSEDAALDNQIRLIQTNTAPAYLPSIWPHAGKINNEFGFRRNPFGGRSYEFHPGMDIDGERGDLVVAPAGGTVIKAGWTGGYGNMLEIDHGNGLTTRFGHLSKIEASVGDTVTRGQLIAYLGSTGRSTGPHLHYEMRINDRSINPRHFLPPEPTDLRAISK